MLSDRQLMKLCLALSVIGVIALFFVVQSVEPKNVEIADINSVMLGQFVVVNGEAVNIYNSETLFFDLTKDSSKIKVVMFKSIPLINEGELITVTGKVSLYRNELEIIASSIEKIV